MTFVVYFNLVGLVNIQQKIVTFVVNVNLVGPVNTQQKRRGTGKNEHIKLAKSSFILVHLIKSYNRLA